MVYLLKPLWYNSYVTHNSNIITDTVIQQFISLSITQVKHLCEIKSYDPQFRTFEYLKREIQQHLYHHNIGMMYCTLPHVGGQMLL